MKRAMNISALVLSLVVLSAASARAGGHHSSGSGNKPSGNSGQSNSNKMVKVAPQNFNGQPINLDHHVCDHSNKTDKPKNNTTSNVGSISDPVTAFHPKQQTVLDLGLVATNVNNLSNVGSGSSGNATPVVRDHNPEPPANSGHFGNVFGAIGGEVSGAFNALTGGNTPPPAQMQKTEAPTYFTAQPGGAGWANATNVTDHRSRTGGK